MQHTIRGSDAFVKEDLRSILDGLTVAARHAYAASQRGQLADPNDRRLLR